MSLIAIVFAFAMQSSITPVGEPESLKWGKETAYVTAESGVAFAVSGPAKLLVNVAAPSKLKNQKVKVEIVRDDAFVSTNEMKLKGRRGGPKGYPVQGTLGFDVPEGDHTYLVRAEGQNVVVVLVPTKRITKRQLAAAEVKMPESATVDAAPPPPAPPAEAAAATPPPAPIDGAGPIGEVEAVSTVAAAGNIPNLAQAKRVAVYDFELQDISDTIGMVVTDSLVTEVRKLEGISVIGMDEIRDMLSHEANKQFLGCESDESCLAEIAGALGVDDLVTGKLSKAADGHVMLVRRIDQRRARVAGTFNQRLNAGTGQEFLLAVGPAVEDLFPDRALREGKERGVAEEVALRLDPPPLPPWSFYSVAGVAVATAAAGGVFGLLANQAEGEFNRTARRDGPIEGKVLVGLETQANDRAVIANASYIAAGTLALSAAVMYLFTDWHGYGNELQR